MTEHLFKLKKDGKTVGYLKIVEGTILFKFAPAEKWENAWLEWLGNEIVFESAHPFVTKDKNGKDVFADDKITFIPAAVFGTKKRQTTTVYFCDRRLAYCVKSKAWDMRIKFNCEDIELIEEQK